MPSPATPTDPRISLERLRNQRLVGANFATAAAAVGALGAVQSQDYYGGGERAGVERATASYARFLGLAPALSLRTS